MFEFEKMKPGPNTLADFMAHYSGDRLFISVSEKCFEAIGSARHYKVFYDKEEDEFQLTVSGITNGWSMQRPPTAGNRYHITIYTRGRGDSELSGIVGSNEYKLEKFKNGTAYFTRQ